MDGCAISCICGVRGDVLEAETAGAGGGGTNRSAGRGGALRAVGRERGGAEEGNGPVAERPLEPVASGGTLGLLVTGGTRGILGTGGTPVLLGTGPTRPVG